VSNFFPPFALVAFVTAHDFTNSEALIILSNVFLAVVTIREAHRARRDEEHFMVKILRLILGKPTPGAHRR